MDPILATVFFPFALRLGLTLHSVKKYWLAIYAGEWSGLLLLAVSLPNYHWQALVTASVLSIPVTLLARRYYKGVQWRLLVVMAVSITVLAVLNTLALSSFHFFDISNTQRLGFVFLVSMTSGLMLVPSCYLIWNYLFQKSWIPLTVDVVSRPVAFRSQHLFSSAYYLLPISCCRYIYLSNSVYLRHFVWRYPLLCWHSVMVGKGRYLALC